MLFLTIHYSKVKGEQKRNTDWDAGLCLLLIAGRLSSEFVRETFGITPRGLVQYIGQDIAINPETLV